MLLFLVLCLLVVGVRGHVDVSCIVFVSGGGTGVMLMFLVLCLLVVGVRGYVVVSCVVFVGGGGTGSC